ncbi:hypothetical protein HG15A2_30230 [Adhaeretor mobilis]|uniref:Uncharacterized protein n=2 Tax=Adhaeretor mobilis TaxID=1930276 RepID=A0A517MXU9_9BACT|nr:hypothetical protein HG15A2_30230 [Adhaeretor mobilis]
MNKKNVILSLAALMLLAGVGWAMGLLGGEDPKVAEAKHLREQLSQDRDKMTESERRASYENLREKTRDLTDEQRRAVWEGGRQDMIQRVDQLLSMPKAERDKELDEWIERSEQRRKEWAANGDQGPRGDRGADATPAERAQRSKQRLDRSTPEMRAKMDALKDIMNQRREERGLDPVKGPRGMFGGGGGR